MALVKQVKPCTWVVGAREECSSSVEGEREDGNAETRRQDQWLPASTWSTSLLVLLCQCALTPTMLSISRGGRCQLGRIRAEANPRAEHLRGSTIRGLPQVANVMAAAFPSCFPGQSRMRVSSSRLDGPLCFNFTSTCIVYL
jgi:hypothetical protein